MLRQFRNTCYWLTPYGDVYSTHNGKYRLLNKENNKGYERVTIYISKKQRHFQIHRMMVESWLGIDLTDLTVDHIDFNPLNNNIKNLQVLTRSENSKRKKVGFFGVNNPKSKTKDADLLLFSQLIGKLKRKEIRELTGITKSSQIRIEKGLTYKPDLERLGVVI